MKSEQKFAMGHTFSSHDIFHNFPIDKLKIDLDKESRGETKNSKSNILEFPTKIS